MKTISKLNVDLNVNSFYRSNFTILRKIFISVHRASFQGQFTSNGTQKGEWVASKCYSSSTDLCDSSTRDHNSFLRRWGGGGLGLDEIT